MTISSSSCGRRPLLGVRVRRLEDVGELDAGPGGLVDIDEVAGAHLLVRDRRLAGRGRVLARLGDRPAR